MGDNERVLLSVSKETWRNFMEYVGANCFSTQLPPAVRGLLAELVLLATSSKDQAMRAGA
jgi:hypothetical protein